MSPTEKGIAVVVDDKTAAIPMVGGAWFDAQEPLKEEAKISQLEP